MSAVINKLGIVITCLFYDPNFKTNSLLTTNKTYKS